MNQTEDKQNEQLEQVESEIEMNSNQIEGKQDEQHEEAEIKLNQSEDKGVEGVKGETEIDLSPNQEKHEQHEEVQGKIQLTYQVFSII